MLAKFPSVFQFAKRELDFESPPNFTENDQFPAVSALDWFPLSSLFIKKKVEKRPLCQMRAASKINYNLLLPWSDATFNALISTLKSISCTFGQCGAEMEKIGEVFTRLPMPSSKSNLTPSLSITQKHTADTVKCVVQTNFKIRIRVRVDLCKCSTKGRVATEWERVGGLMEPKFVWWDGWWRPKRRSSRSI